jgi:hypothetical protein
MRVMRSGAFVSLGVEARSSIADKPKTASGTQEAYSRAGRGSAY